jgi:hypothetical protein
MRDNIQKRSQVLIPLLISIAVFLCVKAADYLIRGQLISIDPQPQFAGSDLVRSFLIALTALLFVMSITQNFRNIVLKKDFSVFVTLNLARGIRFSVGETVVLWFSLLLSFALVLLFVFSPLTFSTLSSEDQIVEVASAFLLFGAGVNLAIVALGLGQQRLKFKSLYVIGLALLAVILLVIGMEEVSWFQRSFGFQTPDAFSGNVQEEFNLHNFASNEGEIFYYLAAFIYLILFPFLYHQVPLFSKSEIISFFSPSLNILLIGAPFAAFNFNLWNNATIQFAFFATLLILMLYVYKEISGPTQSTSQKRYYLATLCFAYLVTQVLFIWQGDKFFKGWEVTEYKELLIPMTFFVYSLEMLMRAKKVVGLRVVLSTAAVGFIVFVLRILQKLGG